MRAVCLTCATVYQGPFARLIANGWTHLLLGPDEYWFCPDHHHKHARVPQRPSVGQAPRTTTECDDLE